MRDVLGTFSAAATILAVRDYRNGIKMINRYEEELLWGKWREEG